MARDGLNITGRDLAVLAEVPYATLARFEAGATIRTETRDKLERALAAAGAAFSAKAGRLGVTVPE
jgi:predicted transcriptional regulator